MKSSTPHVSKVWSKIFEPVIIPLGECRTVRTTYNIYEPSPIGSGPPKPHENLSHKSKAPTSRLFELWTPSNLFNAVQPLRIDYKVRPKVQKCLSFLTKFGRTIQTDLQLPVVINIYSAHRHCPKIDAAQLSAYVKAVYDIEVPPDSISKIRLRIVDLCASTLQKRYVPPYEYIERLCNRLFGSEEDRSQHRCSKSRMQDLIIFMDSVWLSLSPLAQEASIKEWNAYAEPVSIHEAGKEHGNSDVRWYKGFCNIISRIWRRQGSPRLPSEARRTGALSGKGNISGETVVHNDGTPH